MVEKTFFSETLTVNVPRRFVFNFLSDFNKNVRWVQGLQEEDVVMEKGEMIGAKITETIKIHGHTWECRGKVVDFRDGEYLKIHLGDDKEIIILDYTLVDGNYGETLLTETATIREGSLIHRWITGFDKHTLTKRLAKFKEVVEEEYKNLE